MTDRGRLTDALVAAGLAASGERDFVGRVAAIVEDAGIALNRMSIATEMLSPVSDMRLHSWGRQDGYMVARRDRTDSDLDRLMAASPFYAMHRSGEAEMRVRLEGAAPTGFAILDLVRAGGGTDFFACRADTESAPAMGRARDTLVAFASAAPGGFSDADIAALRGAAPLIVLGFGLQAVTGSASEALTTYLGGQAAARVLQGNIRRGQAERIRAVIWSSDLTGFTKISEEIGTEELLALLNAYTGELIGAIASHGGEVLKFMGDGLLAIFPDGAAEAALEAARDSEARLATLNAARQAEGLKTTDFYLALHAGELLFGNFGAPDRLDFTVLGPAVNETARMLSLSKTVDQRIVASKAFADALGQGAGALVSVGRYALRGIGAPQDLYTLDRTR